MASSCIVSPFFEALIDKLSCLMKMEIGLMWGVDKAMKRLASILSTIRDVLEDAEQKHATDEAVLNWLLKLKDLAYDADDILDELETEAEHISHSKQVYLSSLVQFRTSSVAPSDRKEGESSSQKARYD